MDLVHLHDVKKRAFLQKKTDRKHVNRMGRRDALFTKFRFMNQSIYFKLSK